MIIFVHTMSEIALHIEYLLTKHDCVIVPGWGAFLVQYTNAFSFEDNGLYKRPNRFVSFNSSVSHNDGMLVSSLVRKNGITYENACREVADFVATLRKQLDYDGSVAIGRLGFFKKDSELIVFEPCHATSVCSDVFGLKDLRIKTLAQIAQEQNGAEEAVSDTKSDNVVRLLGRRFVQVAASIVLLIGVCFVLSTPITFDESTDYAGLDSAVKIKSPKQVVTLKSEGDLSIALPKCAAEENAEAVINCDSAKVMASRSYMPYEESESDSVIPHNIEGRYYLIVSSLDTKAQADKFIAKHGGDLKVLEGDGRYRIYAAQSNSIKQLAKAKQLLKNTYPDAWIL